jgi:hypothetical protein
LFPTAAQRQIRERAADVFSRAAGEVPVVYVKPDGFANTSHGFTPWNSYTGVRLFTPAGVLQVCGESDCDTTMHDQFLIVRSIGNQRVWFAHAFLIDCVRTLITGNNNFSSVFYDYVLRLCRCDYDGVGVADADVDADIDDGGVGTRRPSSSIGVKYARNSRQYFQESVVSFLIRTGFERRRALPCECGDVGGCRWVVDGTQLCMASLKMKLQQCGKTPRGAMSASDMVPKQVWTTYHYLAAHVAASGSHRYGFVLAAETMLFQMSKPKLKVSIKTGKHARNIGSTRDEMKGIMCALSMWDSQTADIAALLSLLEGCESDNDPQVPRFWAHERHRNMLNCLTARFPLNNTLAFSQLPFLKNTLLPHLYDDDALDSEMIAASKNMLKLTAVLNERRAAAEAARQAVDTARSGARTVLSKMVQASEEAARLAQTAQQTWQASLDTFFTLVVKERDFSDQSVIDSHSLWLLDRIKEMNALRDSSPIVYEWLHDQTQGFSRRLSDADKRIMSQLMLKMQRFEESIDALDTDDTGRAKPPVAVPDPSPDDAAQSTYTNGQNHKPQNAKVKHNVPHYVVDKPNNSKSAANAEPACAHEFDDGKGTKTAGFFKIYCLTCSQMAGWSMMKYVESSRTLHDICISRVDVAPALIVWDIACSACKFSMLREPKYFKHTKFVIDMLHYSGHTACPVSFCPKINAASVNGDNTQRCEQSNQHSSIQKTMLMQCSQQTGIFLLKVWQSEELRRAFGVGTIAK